MAKDPGKMAGRYKKKRRNFLQYNAIEVLLCPISRVGDA